MKISFLIPAHNEEKIISKTLDNLLSIPYKDIEIILGLDGCTDKTEKIVKQYAEKSKKIKYFSLNLREGKPTVIDFIIKKASGDIIIINDADWLFTVKSKFALQKLLSIFKDKKVGGIAEPFPVEWDKENLKKSNFTYKMVAYSSYFWLLYQKERLASKKGDLWYASQPTMFLTNIFRKDLYKKNLSLGDDFERTKYIMDKGYSVILFDNQELPRMIASYNKISLRDFFKQKIRTAMARSQLKQSNIMPLTLFNYYIPANFFIIRKSFRKSPDIGVMMFVWIFLTSIATLISTFKEADTKAGWRLRAKR